MKKEGDFHLLLPPCSQRLGEAKTLSEIKVVIGELASRGTQQQPGPVFPLIAHMCIIMGELYMDSFQKNEI